MQLSKEYLPFWSNLTSKRLKFDNKLDLIEQIIFLDDNSYMLIDRAKNYHIITSNKVYGCSENYEVPSYGENSNPNVDYSVDYINLYHYIYQRKISSKCMEDYCFHIDQVRKKYIQFVYLGDYKIAIQLNSYDPVAIINLNYVGKRPVILEKVYGTKCLIKVNENLIAWYERRNNSVFLYAISSKKRKLLNFTKLKIKGLYSIDENVIIASSKSNIEILDYSRNKIIKSINLINENEEPFVAVHAQNNIISFLQGGCIYVYKIEKGQIKWENYFDLKEHKNTFSSYKFIESGYFVTEVKGNIHIFSISSHNFSLVTVLQTPWTGVTESTGLMLYCCERANKKGFIMDIESNGGSEFVIIECYCQGLHLLHGLQRITKFSGHLKDTEDKLNSPLLTGTSLFSKYDFTSKLLFEEYRDPVAAIDVLNGDSAMFITERGRLFEINLKTFVISYVTEMGGLIIHKGYEMRYIDKLYALDNNLAMISLKTKNSTFVRIILFSLKTKTIHWDSNDVKKYTRGFEKDDELSFYDVIKMSQNNIVLSYNKRNNRITTYQIAELIIPLNDENTSNEEDYVFQELIIVDNTLNPFFDKLWHLSDSLIAMRQVKNVFRLSFLNCLTQEIQSEFRIDKYHSVINVHLWGIIDVKYLQKDIISVHVKMNTHEFFNLIYNIEKQELLNQIKTEHSLIGVINHSEKIGHGKFINMAKTALFGYYGFVDNGLLLKRVKDIIDEEKVKKIEIRNEEFGICINPKNFCSVAQKNLSIVYEGDHNKNYVCVMRSVNFKVELLRVLKKGLGENYHRYVYKYLVEAVFE